MREYAKFPPRMWTEKILRSMRGKPRLQVVAFYLWTAPNSNMIGLYYLPLSFVAHETGTPSEEVEMAIRTLTQFGYSYYDQDEELVYVPDMAAEQVGLSVSEKNEPLLKGILNMLDPFIEHEFGRDFIARYGKAYRLPAGLLEAASRGPAGLARFDGGGPKGMDLFSIRGASRSGEREGERERERTGDGAGDASGARAPARSNTETTWPAGEWLRQFGMAWCEKYQQIAYGNAGDAMATGRLSDLLGPMPEDQRLIAQREASRMFAEFLAKTEPKTVDRRHPWSFFVTEFGGLLAPKQEADKHTASRGESVAWARGVG
jgi:hypothetical protein